MNRICIFCTLGEYNLISNRQCSKCPNDITCEGDKIEVPYNAWVSVKDVSKVNIFSANAKESVLIGSCPKGYCCNDHKGCKFNTNHKQLCQENRNDTVPLCGACNKGYSEVIGTTRCEKCPRHFIERLIYPFVFSFAFAFFYFFFHLQNVILVMKYL